MKQAQDAPSPDHLAEHLAQQHTIPLDEIRSELFELSDADVVRHMFRVAASLDSMVLGEPQILSQVKQAYELACAEGTAGPLAHACFQASLRVARRVASETDLHRHRVSIPSVAIADFARQIFESFDDKRVLVVGAGEMADETLRYLHDEGARQFVIVNRSQQRAEELAKLWNGRVAGWGDLHHELVAADVVISTTAAGQPVVTLDYYRTHVADERHQRPLFVLDLAIPRDFDPHIGDELGVYLYSIDDLSIACDRNRQSRAKELPKAEAIVEEETAKFLAESRHRATVPVIALLRGEFESVKSNELERLFNKLPATDDATRKEIEQFADRLVNKLLHPPMESLRNEAKHGPTGGLLDALRRLFQLKE
jgi:glutamyl-tRNA reductase